MDQNLSRANSGKITRHSERRIRCRIDRLLASGSQLKIRVPVVRFCPWPVDFPFSALRRPTDWLHHLFGHILANLPPKGRADTG
jgi:hypothetical protein